MSEITKFCKKFQAEDKALERRNPENLNASTSSAMLSIITFIHSQALIFQDGPLASLFGVS
jgi:hypothetical protein